MANGGIIAALMVLSLFFTTFTISYFNQGFNGDDSIQIIDLPRESSGYSTSTNLVNSCNLSVYETTGSWTCDSNGLTLTGSGSLRVPLTEVSRDGIYKNSYNLKNTQGDYTIIVTDTRFGDYIHIQVKDDGLYIPSTMALPILGHYETGVAYSVNIPNANVRDNINIQTLYNINSNELTIVFDGITYVPDYSVLPPNYMAPQEVAYVQGIIDANGLSIESMSGNYLSDEKGLAKVIDSMAFAVNIATAMLALATYTFPYDILPLEAQILFIFPQEFLILVGVSIYLRSG